MKRLWVTVTFLLGLAFSSYAPPVSMWASVEKEQYLKETKIEKLEEELNLNNLIDNNIRELKEGNIKSRSEVYDLLLPVLDKYLNKYKSQFAIRDSLSYAVAAIFIIESGNKKGHAARSSLWINHNNPFGLTATKRDAYVRKMSWEQVNGNRVDSIRSFRTFNSFQDACNALMVDYLLKKRYHILREARSVKEFLYLMHKTGYTTNPRYGYHANSIYQEQVKKEQLIINNRKKDLEINEIKSIRISRLYNNEEKSM